jgi:hypothetical protein
VILLRVASLVVLALWVGGLAVLAFVAAPAIFGTLEARDAVGGRMLAADVFGVVFTRFQHWAWGLGGLLAIILTLRALVGPRPHRLALRLWTIAAMVALSVGTVLAVAPRIERIRSEVHGAVSTLPDDDPRKAEFGRLHALSTAFMGLTLMAGMALFWAETRDPH